MNWKYGRGWGRAGLAFAIGSAAFASLIFGAASLVRFDSTPGPVSRPPVRWPAASGVSRATGRAQLVLFAHPQCGCTAATLGELAKLPIRLSAGVRPPAITVLFFRPGPESGWQPSSTPFSTWKEALALPDAQAEWDDGAREAKRFGVFTSGAVLLFDADGKLLFHGGVTGARGHAGDNRGLSALLSALNSGRSAAPSPVFGCSLGARSSTEANRS